ncbi:MAG TPA: AAA family ATPase [Bryobacteraceae bacterium]|jgi:DNA polymerase-3 subunit delta'|nr:AAA family ATPase [Bryobacteraceae bacterium]
MFPDFYGNRFAAETLAQMIERGRIAQTILLAGPEGVGKATLARRFGAALLGDARKIEQDDLSLEGNREIIEQREKWTAEKRNEDPLLFSTHPDFVTFAPEGPLRQIGIPQMRLLRERASFKPTRGAHRVFLIDHLERANEQAANSLLKVLEEPPEHLVIIATAENLYDLLPTIRSRAVVLEMRRLDAEEMAAFAAARKLPDAELRSLLAEGAPGVAATLDLGVYQARRELLVKAFECAAGVSPFASWIQHSEGFSMKKSEKLEFYLKPAYDLLEDLLAAVCGRELRRNRDIRGELGRIAAKVNFDWLEEAARALDELVLMVRRNIQKTAALDAMIIKLRNRLQTAGT